MPTPDTVPKFSKHIIICDQRGSATTWPKKIEDHRNSNIQQALSTLKHQNWKITLCDRGNHSSNDDQLELFVFDGSQQGKLLSKVEASELGKVKKFRSPCFTCASILLTPLLHCFGDSLLDL